MPETNLSSLVLRDDAEEVNGVARIPADLPVTGDCGPGPGRQAAQAFAGPAPLCSLVIAHLLPPFASAGCDRLKPFFSGLVGE
jgi:hypothetical protein